jgi:hypothetical protein
MKFRLKDLDVLEVEPMLAVVLEEVKNRFDLSTITCAGRKGDRGVHGTNPLRGIDIRCRDLGVGNRVEEWVNGLWEYDPSRQEKAVCLCHDTGQGMHLHFQVHPKTRRRLG